jgi:predicted transcriptional regulator
MNVQEFGIQNTKEVLKLGAAVTVLAHGLKNGFQVTEEVPNIIAVGTAIVPAIDGIELVDDEVFDMTPEEENELNEYVIELLSDWGFVTTDVKLSVADYINAAAVITRASGRLVKK